MPFGLNISLANYLGNTMKKYYLEIFYALAFLLMSLPALSALEKTSKEKFTFVLPDSSEIVVKQGQLWISDYFQRLFRLKEVVEPKHLETYKFDELVSPSAAKFIADYIKDEGDRESQIKNVRKALNGKDLLEIYFLASKLLIKPLLSILDLYIIDNLHKTGLLLEYSKLQFDEFNKRLDTLLLGRLDHIIEAMESNLNYFDWEKPKKLFRDNFDAIDIDAIKALAFSPDSSLLAIAGGDFGFLLYDVKEEDIIDFIESDDFVRSVAFSPNGSIIALGLYDAIVKLYDIKNRKIVKTIVLPYDQDRTSEVGIVRTIAFSPDGRFLITVLDEKKNQLQIYDLELGKVINTSSFPWNATVLKFVFSNNNERMSVIFRDQPTAFVFDLKQQKFVGTYKLSPIGNADVISPNSLYRTKLENLSKNASEFKIMDLLQQKELLKIKFDPTKMFGEYIVGAFSPDGRNFVINDWEKKDHADVRLYSLDLVPILIKLYHKSQKARKEKEE